MEKFYSKENLFLAPDVKIRFGQESEISNLWKNIISVQEQEKREKLVDNLLEIMGMDTEKNGFFGKEDRVDCGNFRAFVLDDKSLYYMFFENLRNLSNQNVGGKISDGSIINQAIRATIRDYAGGDGVDRDERLKLTTLTDEGLAPSISRQKGKNCFYCTERAAISHNLWLLTGAKSYFCWTNSDSFGAENPEYKNDTHNFTIVEYDDKFRLYDLAMDNFCFLENDCIDKLLSGKGLKVEQSKTVANPGVYAQNLSEKAKSKQD